MRAVVSLLVTYRGFFERFNRVYYSIRNPILVPFFAQGLPEAFSNIFLGVFSCNSLSNKYCVNFCRNNLGVKIWFADVGEYRVIYSDMKLSQFEC